MPKFAANLTFLFTEFPQIGRIEQASKAGFDAVEILFPYDLDATALKFQLGDHNIPLALINTPPTDWDAGGRGLAAVPGQQDTFRRDFTQALELAQTLNAQHIHIMSGIANGPEASDTFLKNLEWASLQDRNQSLTIEPINSTDIPGYFLNSFDHAAEIISSLAMPNLALQFDTYHAQIITNDVQKTWEEHGELATHIQVANTPSRHEPSSDPFDHQSFFRYLDQTGYSGLVSGEYHPKACTVDGLNWCDA